MTTFDRPAVLRNAQKLLRVGKLNQAIEQYVQVLRECPDDLETAATLGNLYVRAGSPDHAVDHFLRIADGLRSRGLLSQAAVAYQRMLAIADDNEHAWLQLADIACDQQQFTEARTYLTAVEEQRRARGDRHGAAEILIRLAALDPHDVNARLIGARARQETGDVKGALADLQSAARICSRRVGTPMPPRCSRKRRCSHPTTAADSIPSSMPTCSPAISRRRARPRVRPRIGRDSPRR